MQVCAIGASRFVHVNEQAPHTRKVFFNRSMESKWKTKPNIEDKKDGKETVCVYAYIKDRKEVPDVVLDRKIYSDGTKSVSRLFRCRLHVRLKSYTCLFDTPKSNCFRIDAVVEIEWWRRLSLPCRGQSEFEYVHRYVLGINVISSLAMSRLFDCEWVVHCWSNKGGIDGL